MTTLFPSKAKRDTMASHGMIFGMPRVWSSTQSIFWRIAPCVGVLLLVHASSWLLFMVKLGNPKHDTKEALREEISLNPEEYHIFDDACLESQGLRQWNLFVSNRSPSFSTTTIQLRNFIGNGDFAMEEFKIFDKANVTTALSPNIQKGTFLITITTHANNFHIINDILLPVFRLYRKAKLDGILIPEGCADCWKQQLPIQSIGLDMMNTTVLYPMEGLISNMTPPMCFDRLILQRHDQGAYYKREGRFTDIWTLEIFLDFRDTMINYFQKRWASMPGSFIQNARDASISREPMNTSLVRGKKLKSAHKKPVLSWVSRGSGDCTNRCITNEQAAIEQLSKYFDVNVLDFSKGLTTDQAMAYIHETNVLIGLHGAGLAYTAFLPDGAMLVELRGEYSNRMFLNMASSVNIPFYAVSLPGCVGPGKDDVYNLTTSLVHNMTEEIYSAFMYEQQNLTNVGSNMTDGNCEFPQPVMPCGRLSLTHHARCYLHQDKRLSQTTWFQCAWHDWC